MAYRKSRFLPGLIVLLLAACSNREISRVAVPGTDLTVVVVEDWKDMYWYRFYQGDAPVSTDRLLGPRYDSNPSGPVVERQGSVVKLSWPSQRGVHFIEFDTVTHRVIQDSNGSGPLPTFTLTK